MDNSEVYSSNRNNNFFRKRYTATCSFATAILLFLLPFAELKCGTVTLAGNTGVGIALGRQWKVVDMGEGNELMDKLNSPGKEGKKSPMDTGVNIFAIAAIAAGLAGLLFSLFNIPLRPVLGISAGLLGTVMLVALMIQFRILLRSATAKGGDNPYDMGMIIKIQFTAWYYLSLAAFAAAAFFSYKHHQIELQDAMSGVVDFEFQLKKE